MIPGTKIILEKGDVIRVRNKESEYKQIDISKLPEIIEIGFDFSTIVK